MKTLLTTPITPTAGLPITGPTLDFIQKAHSEMFSLLVQSMIGPQYDSAENYIIQGARRTGTGLSTSVSNGLIVVGGVLCRLIGAAVPLTVGQDVYINVTDTFLAGVDPVTFTDLSTHDVHQDRVVTLSAGTSGTLLSDCIYINRFINVTAPATAFSPALNSKYSGTITFVQSNGVLNFSGTISGLAAAGAASGDVLFTLPPGHRPTVQQQFLCTNDSAFPEDFAKIVVFTSGAVGVYTKSANTNLQNRVITISGTVQVY